MAYDVFISYSTPDKLTADASCAVLESKGIRCWIAPRNIPLGADWTESIVDALEVCKVMVLIFSKHANESHQVKREVNIAVDSGVTIIPMRVEDILPSKSLKYSIELTHWLDAFQPPLERHLEVLAESICGLLKTARAAEEEAPGSTPPVALPKSAPAFDSGIPASRADISVPAPEPKRKRSGMSNFVTGTLWTLALYIAGVFLLFVMDVTLDLAGTKDSFTPFVVLGVFILPFISLGLVIWLMRTGRLPWRR